MNQIKLSIIIPVFNGEKNISRCLDSLKNQTEKEFQLIIIDDGSTDNSWEIMQNYSSEFSNIKLIQTPNRGVSSARNLGIAEAEGEYLTFLDCDDWIEKNTIENYYSDLENNDLLIYNFITDNDPYEIKEKKIEDLTKEKAQQLSLDSKVKGYVWNRIYKAQIIKDNHLSFNPDYAFCEDLNFNVKFTVYSEEIKYINQKYYHYENNEESVTAQQFSKKKITALNAISDSITILDSENVKTAYQTHFYHILLSLLVYGKQENKLDRDLEKSLRKHLWDYKLLNGSFNKVKLAVVLFRFFPSLSYKIWETTKNR